MRLFLESALNTEDFENLRFENEIPLQGTSDRISTHVYHVDRLLMVDSKEDGRTICIPMCAKKPGEIQLHPGQPLAYRIQIRNQRNVLARSELRREFREGHLADDVEIVIFYSPEQIVVLDVGKPEHFKVIVPELPVMENWLEVFTDKFSPYLNAWTTVLNKLIIKGKHLFDTNNLHLIDCTMRPAGAKWQAIPVTAVPPILAAAPPPPLIVVNLTNFTDANVGIGSSIGTQVALSSSDNRPHKCPLCDDANFKTKNLLHAHIRNNHSDAPVSDDV
jgi:hypothetical protein